MEKLNKENKKTKEVTGAQGSQQEQANKEANKKIDDDGKSLEKKKNDQDQL